MSETVLVAGASGMLGRQVTRALQRSGMRVRALTRDPHKFARADAAVDEVVTGDARVPAQAASAVAGVHAVISCLGASVQPALGHGWRGFFAVDTRANTRLIEAAEAAGVERFVYVSTMHRPGMEKLAYVRAHETVARRLLGGKLAGTVIRPTGFFSALASLLEMARSGPLPQIGDGTARSNPIADEDLAEVCVRALEVAPGEQSVGGPETHSRRELGEMVFAALGLPPKFRTVSPAAVRTVGTLLRPLHPRLGQLLPFYAAVSTTDVVAPRIGTRRIGEFFREQVAAGT